MSGPETNGGIEKRRISALGISSLLCGIIAAAAALVSLTWLAMWICIGICLGLSYICGVGALIQSLIQRVSGRRCFRLWWLALCGMIISTGLLVYLVIMMITLAFLGSV